VDYDDFFFSNIARPTEIIANALGASPLKLRAASSA